MSHISTLLTILMDRRKHSRTDLLSRMYRKVRGTQSGRLAARVNDLRRRGYLIESPKIRYVNGRLVRVKTKFVEDKKNYWYKLLGSKTVWKDIETRYAERKKRRLQMAAKKGAETRRKAKLLDEE